jgi:predicted RNA-binding protein with EMAP domain
MKPMHLNWLVKSSTRLQTKDGHEVNIFDLLHSTDDETLSLWAKHLRNHYCRDNDIDEFRKPTGLSRKEYLMQLKLPDRGPILSGDFSEILIADYIQFCLNYIVPRTRYDRKINKNTPSHGIDILAFRILNQKKDSTNDKLLTCEVKAALQKNKSNTLIKAIEDSKKDFTIRKPESLNAMRQRLKDRNRQSEVEIVDRFQNYADRPYMEISGAACVHSNHTWQNDVVTQTNVNEHPNQDNLFLMVIKGEQLMDLVHKLFRRAADEA